MLPSDIEKIQHQMESERCRTIYIFIFDCVNGCNPLPGKTFASYVFGKLDTQGQNGYDAADGSDWSEQN